MTLYRSATAICVAIVIACGPPPLSPTAPISQSAARRAIEGDLADFGLWVDYVGHDDDHPTILLSTSSPHEMSKTPPHFMAEARISRAQAAAIADWLDGDGSLSQALHSPPGGASPWNQRSGDCYLLSLSLPSAGLYVIALDDHSARERLAHLRRLVDGDAGVLMDRLLAGLATPMHCQ